MIKIDKTSAKEIGAIALWMLILSAVMQAIFLVIGKWNYTVLLGNLLSYAVVMLNLLAVGVLLQTAMERDPKSAKQFVKATGGIRFLVMFGLLAVGVVLDCFSTWTVIIPVFFPRIIVMILPFVGKKSTAKEEEINGCSSEGANTGDDTDKVPDNTASDPSVEG